MQKILKWYLKPAFSASRTLGGIKERKLEMNRQAYQFKRELAVLEKIKLKPQG